MPSTSSIFHFLPNTPSTSSPYPTHSDLPPILHFQHPSPHYFSASSSSPRSLGHLSHYALSFIFLSSLSGSPMALCFQLYLPLFDYWSPMALCSQLYLPLFDYWSPMALCSQLYLPLFDFWSPMALCSDPHLSLFALGHLWHYALSFISPSTLSGQRERPPGAADRQGSFWQMFRRRRRLA